MHWMEVIATSTATLVMLGAAFKFMWGRLDKKFKEIDDRFLMVLAELKEIKMDIRSLEQRIARLETQDEERFRNDIKVLIKDRAAK